MRIPRPHYKKSHACWYVKINGKFHRLDQDKTRAFEIYKELLAEHSGGEELASPQATVQDLLMEFLAWVEKHREPATLAWYQKYISGPKGFAAYIRDDLRVRDLRPFHVTRWIDSRYPKADADTQAGAITAIKRAFNWAKQQGYIKASPVADVAKPARTSRGEEAYLMPDQWKQVVAAVEAGQKPHEVQPFLDYITVMKETGCRPQEIRKVEARHLDHSNKRWVFPKEESKGKKDKRIVELGDVAYAICRRLALARPKGPLFLNSDGRPWTNFALSCRCRRLEEKLGFQVFPYAIRHTFATEAILNGVDVITIARLMGHKDLQMLNRIYQHVMRDKQHMREARKRATRSREDDAA